MSARHIGTSCLPLARSTALDTASPVEMQERRATMMATMIERFAGMVIADAALSHCYSVAPVSLSKDSSDLLGDNGQVWVEPRSTSSASLLKHFPDLFNEADSKHQNLCPASNGPVYFWVLFSLFEYRRSVDWSSSVHANLVDSARKRDGSSRRRAQHGFCELKRVQIDRVPDCVKKCRHRAPPCRNHCHKRERSLPEHRDAFIYCMRVLPIGW